MHYLPQEIESWYIIPAIRRDISLCLIKDFNTSYEKVGKILGVSKAAISQYSKGKRAAKIKLPKEVTDKVMSSCKLLSSGKSDAVTEIQKLINVIQKKNLSCCVCKETHDGVLDNCKEISYKNNNYVTRKK